MSPPTWTGIPLDFVDAVLDEELTMAAVAFDPAQHYFRVLPIGHGPNSVGHGVF